MHHRGLAAVGIACALTTALLTGSAGEGAHAAGSAGTAATAAHCASVCDRRHGRRPGQLRADGAGVHRLPRVPQVPRQLPAAHAGDHARRATDTTATPISGAVVLLAATSADLTTMVPVRVNRTDRDGRYVLRTAMTGKLRALHKRHGVDLHMEWFHPRSPPPGVGEHRQWDPDRRAWGGTKVDPTHRGPATRTPTARNREDITPDPRAGADVSGWCTHTGGHTRAQVPAAR